MASRSKYIVRGFRSPFLRRVETIAERASSGQFPFDLPAFSTGIDIEFTSSVTFFVGENGSGKSTLLEAIAENAGLNPEGGGREHNFSHHDDKSELAAALRLSWMPKVIDGFFLRAESFFNFATYLENSGSRFERFGGRQLHNQSHGESFLALFANRFRQGLYILDEPEAALSPQRQLSVLSILHRLDTAGHAQFLISTHSPIILLSGARCCGAWIAPMAQVNYEDTDHYKVTKQFLISPDRYFRHLFTDEEE